MRRLITCLNRGCIVTSEQDIGNPLEASNSDLQKILCYSMEVGMQTRKCPNTKLFNLNKIQILLITGACMHAYIGSFLQTSKYVYRYIIFIFFYIGLQLNFTMTWGDCHYLGLTGLEVIGKNGRALSISTEQISASPQDLNDLPEYTADSRTLGK